MTTPDRARPRPLLSVLTELAATRRVQYVLIAAAILGLIIGLDTVVVHVTLDPFADVHAYYDAGARLNAGQPLYGQAATTDDAAFYRYPPLLAIAFRPLATLSFETASAIWEGVLLAAFALTIVRLGVRRRSTWLLLGWLAAPMGWSLAIGQAQVLVTLLLTIGSPWAVALACHLKLFPVLVAVYWAGRRDGRAILRLVAWGVGFLLLSFVLEPAGTLSYLGFPDLAQVGNVRNLSPYAVSPALWLVFAAVLVAVAWRLAPTRFGWAAAVFLSVLATPRLLMYQFSSLLAVARPEPHYTAPDADAR
jgi:Glycosyltransferase family 87